MNLKKKKIQKRKQGCPKPDVQTKEKKKKKKGKKKKRKNFHYATLNSPQGMW